VTAHLVAERLERLLGETLRAMRGTAASLPGARRVPASSAKRERRIKARIY